MIIREPTQLSTLALKDQLVDQGLGLGEAFSIALAKELDVVFLANDKQAIIFARESSVRTRWFTEIFHDALKTGELASIQEFTTLLDASISKGLYLSRRQREQAIGRARQIKA